MPGNSADNNPCFVQLLGLTQAQTSNQEAMSALRQQAKEQKTKKSSGKMATEWCPSCGASDGDVKHEPVWLMASPGSAFVQFPHLKATDQLGRGKSAAFHVHCLLGWKDPLKLLNMKSFLQKLSYHEAHCFLPAAFRPICLA